MEKSDLNSSMVFKLRNLGLCVLLDKKSNEEKAFYDKELIEKGYSGGLAEFVTYDLTLKNRYDEDYDIVAIKQYSDCVKAISVVLKSEEPDVWDWVEEVEKVEDNTEESQTPIINNITVNITVDSSNDDPEKIMTKINDVLKRNGLKSNISKP